MQEPQYSSPGVRQLLETVAAVEVPCISVMNMPPLTYLKRIPGLDTGMLRPAYTYASVWHGFDTALLTLCSPDPQAIRPADEKSNVLQVTLPTNFKVARFDSEKHNVILRRLQHDIEAIRWDTDDGQIELPVKLKVHDSIFVPLAKWPMLLTGNYRCITENGAMSIKAAVHSEPEASRTIYNFVHNLCVNLGATPNDLIPFERYASAADSLTRPSSPARALDNGALEIERADKLIQAIAAQKGLRNPTIDSIVALVDARLEANRKKAAA
jgi:hypothetical protein